METNQRLLEQLLGLAQQQLWDELGVKAHALKTAAERAGSIQTYVLVLDTVPSSSVLNSFLAWVENRTGQPTPLLRLGAGHPTTLPPLARVIFFLPSDYLLQQADLDWLREAVLNRPLHTYAIVVGLANEVTDENDMADVEDRMRRVFVGGLVGVGYQGGLAGVNCFLYSPDPARSASAASRRAITDETLGAWLAGTAFPAEALMNHELNRWLDEAQQKTASATPSSADNSDAMELNDLIVSINELRRKVTRRLSEAQTDVQRELTVSLRTAEQLARQQWAKIIEGHQGGWSAEAASKWLNELVKTQLQEWQDRLAFNDRLDRIVRQATDPIDFADWSRVNAFLTDARPHVHYPEALAFETIDRGEITNGKASSDDLVTPPDKTAVYLGQTALTGIVIAGVGAIFGLLPGVIAGGIAGLGMYFRNRQVHREQVLEAGLQAISRYFQDRIQELTRRLPDVFEPIEGHFNERFRQVRQQLQAKLDTLTVQPEQPVVSPDAAQQITEFRRQLQQA